MRVTDMAGESIYANVPLRLTANRTYGLVGLPWYAEEGMLLVELEIGNSYGFYI